MHKRSPSRVGYCPIREATAQRRKHREGLTCTDGEEESESLYPLRTPSPEVELGRMAPEGVSVHVTRMFRPRDVTGLDQSVLETTNQSLPQAAGAIAPLKPNVLVFAHTMGSIVAGPGRGP